MMRRVGDVERLRGEFHAHALGKTQSPAERAVHVDQSRPPHAVGSARTEVSRRRVAESTDVVPLVDVPQLHRRAQAIAELAGPRCVQSGVGVRHSERSAAAENADEAQLPSAENRSGHPAIQVFLPFAKW